MSQVGRHRFARLGPNLVLIGAAIFFIAPILSTARQALQNVDEADGVLA